MKLTSKQKINFFKKEVKKFIELHGLVSYDVYIAETHNEECEACCDLPDSNRKLAIRYNTTWLKEENNLKNISLTAYHEVLELFFISIREMASERHLFFSNVQVDNEIHKLIRTMENVYFNLIK